jgi:hypothetical protein
MTKNGGIEGGKLLIQMIHHVNRVMMTKSCLAKVKHAVVFLFLGASTQLNYDKKLLSKIVKRRAHLLYQTLR